MLKSSHLFKVLNIKISPNLAKYWLIPDALKILMSQIYKFG